MSASFKDLRVGVIGLGYWGPNLVRNFADVAGATLTAVCDQNEQRLATFKKKYPWVMATPRADDLFQDPSIDAVAIATPVFTHFDLARRALEAGKHVLIEKPLAASSKEAEQLIELARKKNLILMVDHVFVYTPAVRRVKELIQSGELGNVLYFDSVRVNLGLFQSDVNVVWDLAPHDLSIMDYLLEDFPVAVRAMGARHAHSDFENVAYVHFKFKNDMIAHFHLNWLAPVKIRQILIGGTKKMVVYNDIEPTEKIKIYDKGIDVRKDAADDGRFQTLISYRTGDVLAPKIDSVEALNLVCRDFVQHIRTGNRNFVSDGRSGLRVVRLLEAIQESLKRNGELVTLENESTANEKSSFSSRTPSLST